MTAGAALLVAGKARTIKDGVRLAQTAIDEGSARKALDMLVKVSNS
jgi:anthranilate phosphoribosyltransferase